MAAMKIGAILIYSKTYLIALANLTGFRFLIARPNLTGFGNLSGLEPCPTFGVTLSRNLISQINSIKKRPRGISRPF